jgi:hypothetical protein
LKNSHRKLSVLSSSPCSPFTQHTILVLMNSFSAEGFSEWHTSRDPNMLSLLMMSSKTSVQQPFHSFEPKCCSQFIYTTKITTEGKETYHYTDCYISSSNKTQLCTYSIVLYYALFATGCIRRHHTMRICRS